MAGLSAEENSMAFTPETISIIVQPIGGEGMRFISYKTDDVQSTVTATDYFANAERYGIQISDLIFVSPVSADFDAYVLVVTAIDAEGNVTASVNEEEMQASVYDPQGIAGDAFARANHTGVQAISTVTGLQTALNARLVTANNLSELTATASTARANIGAGDLLASNNLSDVSDAATARANLGLAAAGEFYATRALIKALPTPAAGDTVVLTENLRAGVFVFRAGDYSTFITTDTVEGLYLKADDTLATSGAWVRQWDGEADARWFGLSTAASGATNATALNVALSLFRDIYVPPGTFDIGATLVVPAFTTLRGAGKYVSVLNKTFNGDMLTLGTGSNLETIALDGNGGTYTGRGVTIGTGTGSQWITNCRIEDFDDYCVEYTAAGAGTQGGIGEGRMVSRTNTGDVCIQYPNDASAASPRFLLGVIGGGSQILCDTGSAQNLFICNCYCSTINTTSGAGKVLVWGTRIATIGATITFQGSDLIVGGCAIAGAVVWEAGAGSVFSDTNIHNGFTDNTNSAQVGKIHHPAVAFTPTWKGDSSDPAIGNGTITGHVSAHGKHRKYTIQMTAGSTTTFGSGNWYFPLAGSNNVAKTTCVGSVYGLDSGTAFLAGSCFIAAGDNKIRMVSDGAGNFWNATSPHTWATSDYFNLCIDIELT